MAEQMTQIAQELERIKYAKGLIGASAEVMGLIYTDDEGLSYNVNSNSPIENIADALDNIDVYHGNEVDVEEQRPSEGVVVEKDAVTVKKGFHAYTQVAKVEPGNVPSPTISVDANTGVITASVTPGEGYVYEIKKTSTQTISHENLNAENIKADTKIFGVTGTFTSDASITIDGKQDGIDTSSLLSDGCIVYAKGKKVVGTLPFMPGETIVYFNPLEEEIHTAISTPAHVRALSVRLSDELLNALKAI